MREKRKAGVQIKVVHQDGKWAARGVFRGELVALAVGDSIAHAVTNLHEQLKSFDWYQEKEKRNG